MSPAPSATRASSLRLLADFLQLGRPLHLAGGFLFNGLGIAVAAFLGAAVDWTVALWGQAAITSFQLMTHYSNEYFDLEADRATLTPTRWASGSRVLPEGRLSPRLALVTALILMAAGLGATLVLAVIDRPALLAALPLLLLALTLAWGYSSPPLWLNRRGWGEIAGALLIPGLTTLVGYQLQAGQLALLPFLTAMPLCLFQFVMLLSVNFPDAAGDALVGKRTLVVKLGPGGAARLFVAALLAPYLLLPVLLWLGLPSLVGLAVLLTFPLAGWQVWRIRRGAATDPAQWDPLAFWSIGLLVGTGFLELLAYLALIWP